MLKDIKFKKKAADTVNTTRIIHLCAHKKEIKTALTVALSFLFEFPMLKILMIKENFHSKRY